MHSSDRVTWVSNHTVDNFATVSQKDHPEEWHNMGIREKSCPAGIGIKLIFYVSNDSSVFVQVVLAVCQ